MQLFAVLALKRKATLPPPDCSLDHLQFLQPLRQAAAFRFLFIYLRIYFSYRALVQSLQALSEAVILWGKKKKQNNSADRIKGCIAVHF